MELELGTWPRAMRISWKAQFVRSGFLWVKCLQLAIQLLRSFSDSIVYTKVPHLPLATAEFLMLFAPSVIRAQ